MINEKCAKRFCCEDISLIENYDKAIADQTQTWHIHHRLETQTGKHIYAKKLVELGLYYNRPAAELIFLTKADHNKVHFALIRTKGFLGHRHTEETKKKISLAGIGRPGHRMSDDVKKKMKSKISNTLKGNCYWFNNGVVCVRAKKCPEGFTPGRLKMASKSSS